MSRHLVKIGNIRELQGGRGLGLGKRIRALTSQALDRGQTVASEEIDAFFGRTPPDEGPPGEQGPEPGFTGDTTNDNRIAGLEQYLPEDELEQILANLGQVLGALEGVPGRAAHHIRRGVRSLIEEVGGPVDYSDGSGGLAGGGGGFGNGYVDVIGLDGSGGVATGAFTDPGEWR